MNTCPECELPVDAGISLVCRCQSVMHDACAEQIKTRDAPSCKKCNGVYIFLKPDVDMQVLGRDIDVLRTRMDCAYKGANESRTNIEFLTTIESRKRKELEQDMKNMREYFGGELAVNAIALKNYADGIRWTVETHAIQDVEGAKRLRAVVDEDLKTPVPGVYVIGCTESGYPTANTLGFIVQCRSAEEFMYSTTVHSRPGVAFMGIGSFWRMDGSMLKSTRGDMYTLGVPSFIPLLPTMTGNGAIYLRPSTKQNHDGYGTMMIHQNTITKILSCDFMHVTLGGLIWSYNGCELMARVYSTSNEWYMKRLNETPDGAWIWGTIRDRPSTISYAKNLVIASSENIAILPSQLLCVVYICNGVDAALLIAKRDSATMLTTQLLNPPIIQLDNGCISHTALVSADGKWLITVDKDNTIAFSTIDIEKKQVVHAHKRKVSDSRITRIAFSPDYRYITALDETNTLYWF